MNNPYHAMLAEMAAELDWSQQRLMGNRTATHPLANRARVLLDQQEPEGLTDEKIPDNYAGHEKGFAQEHLARLMRDAIGTETNHNAYIVAAGRILDRPEFACVARWGRPTPQPRPEGPMPLPGDAEGLAEVFWAQPVAEEPTDDEIEEWADACSEAPLQEMDPEVHGWRRCFTAKEFSETIRAALIHWGQPAERVVVVERVLGAKDCDEQGRCWWLDTDGGRIEWVLCGPGEGWTRRLPANALPIPKDANG